jgi:hypothetical protein
MMNLMLYHDFAEEPREIKCQGAELCVSAF